MAGMWDKLVLVAGCDKLCSVAIGRRLWKLLQSCNDWMGVREAGKIISCRSLVSAQPPRSQATQSARLVFCRPGGIHGCHTLHNAKLKCETAPAKHSHFTQPRNSVLIKCSSSLVFVRAKIRA